MSKRVNVGDYFEGTLQLRPKNPKLLNFVLQRIEPVKVVDYKFGYDIFIKDKQEGFELSAALKKEFGGETIKTRTIFGGGYGKRIVYRHTYLFRQGEQQEQGDQ